MSNITLDLSELRPFHAKIIRAVPGFRAGARQVDRRALVLLLQYIRMNAPVASGAHRAAIHIMGMSVVSGTPYAARLEYGFVGVDALGRHYNQSPQSHFRTGAEQLRPVYAQMYVQLVRKVLW